jgi:hypothetical protein
MITQLRGRGRGERHSMRIFLFLAVVANSLDLVLTAVGIHWPGLGNREGNPILAPMVQHQWPLFVLIKGAIVPLLIVQLHRYRRETPLLANLGMVIVTVALVVALGQWLGWMAGVWRVASLTRL